MQKRILFLSNHFLTLYKFRKELIEKFIEDGNEVFISMPKAAENSIFKDMGCKIIETSVDRRGINPIKDLKLIFNYIKIMRNLKPDIIFSYTIKPNIYGSIASNLIGLKQINNITGTGATFIKNNLLSKIAKFLYKISVKQSYKVFFQNKGDQDFFVRNKMVNNNYKLLPGSGVNLHDYNFCKMPSFSSINFIFIGRIMALKGIEQYLECAKVIKERNPNTNFYIAGFVEEDKFKEIIHHYHSMGIVKYLGFQNDIKNWISKCHCTILPSLGGEGIPNVLLESAAMGRVCIASMINGSIDVIDNYKTGYLFRAGDSVDLIAKVKDFINLNDSEKEKMANAARRKVEKEFNREIVIDTYLEEVKLLTKRN